MSEAAYFLFSGSTAFLGVGSVFVAEKAMRRGLTYGAMRATVWALIFFALARIWHTVREVAGFESELAEVIEYAQYVIGYLMFIGLALRTKNLRLPNEMCKNAVTPTTDPRHEGSTPPRFRGGNGGPMKDA